MNTEGGEVARLLEVWVALRRTALKKRTPEARAAAEAAYTAFRDHLVADVPQPREADDSETAAARTGPDDEPAGSA